MRPLVLNGNQLHRFYAGGPAIAEFRSVPSIDNHAPEDWVGSTTTIFGEPTRGLTRLRDDRLLREAIDTEPEAFLGADHVAAYGTDTQLLVKLLDAGERLPVHAHPDRAFAVRHLDCPHGKTEAWIVIGVRGVEPSVYLGFRNDVGSDELSAWVDRQDSEEMLAALHGFTVAPGDTVFVPSGIPHAIGEGVFVVELQEPTDFSVLLEWSGFEIDGRADGHLGLGFDLALQAVDRSGWDADRLDALRGGRSVAAGAPPGRRQLLPSVADPYFRAERLRPAPTVRLDAGYAILVVIDGAGELATDAGGRLPLRRGATLLVPHAAGAATLSGDIDVIRCRPPAAEAATGGG